MFATTPPLAEYGPCALPRQHGLTPRCFELPVPAPIVWPVPPCLARGEHLGRQPRIDAEVIIGADAGTPVPRDVPRLRRTDLFRPTLPAPMALLPASLGRDPLPYR